MALKQSLQQRLLQKLSPQQIQLMKMLQLPTVELEKRIKEELEINPALDEGEEQANETNADLEENRVLPSLGHGVGGTSSASPQDKDATSSDRAKNSTTHSAYTKQES